MRKVRVDSLSSDLDADEINALPGKYQASDRGNYEQIWRSDPRTYEDSCRIDCLRLTNKSLGEE